MSAGPSLGKVALTSASAGVLYSYGVHKWTEDWTDEKRNEKGPFFFGYMGKTMTDPAVDFFPKKFLLGATLGFFVGLGTYLKRKYLNYSPIIK